ncbi:hypothetical protein Y032_0036g3182 [Ancylostoma ceylanicum]|uniref:BPTI/Kunitz inhibitor domain-containing protein n=1 Tax=Ancylostoma ceylanicum TaxID=53326 RepID=A0A016ULW9_9BILA|nr:hypothetical protein Y032_0036g3182 [Ancylostoma ceylanicum]
MKLTVVALCVLICFSTSALAAKNRDRRCKAGMPKMITFIACTPGDSQPHAFNKKTNECELCCGCLPRDRFESKNECESTCKK